jgi:hypothetical protein
LSFCEEVRTYRFRLLGPRFRAGKDGRYRLPRPNGGKPATVLESGQLVLAQNNVSLGSMEGRLKAPLRELSAMSPRSSLACGAVVNAAVRHLAGGCAFVSTNLEDGFMLLAGMLGNDGKTCIGIGDFRGADDRREAFRTLFDSRRSSRHSLFEGDYRDYFAGAVPPIGVLLQSDGHSYEHQLRGLQAAEPFLADRCLVVVDGANHDAPRRAAFDFVRASRLSWRVVLDGQTVGQHPTLGNGLLVFQAGSSSGSQVQLATETRLVEAVEVDGQAPSGSPPRVTVLHYRNPWVGVQDYPNLEVVGLNRGTTLTKAFQRSTGDYVVVLDPDVRLTSDAVSEAVRQATNGGAPAAGRRRRTGRRYRPLVQAEYFPRWAQTFDDGHEAQTVTVARALTVTRDNLVALDLDPDLADSAHELAVRFGPGLRLEGPAARCSRVPDGVVAGRVGAVLTPDGGWLVESVGAASRAWPELALDDDRRIQLADPVRESDEAVATVVCERRREWWTANYGHWTLDVLTRVAMLLRAGAPDDVKVLVPEPVLPFQRATLVGLGIAEDRILPWDGRPTRFRTVYVPTARPTPPFVFPAGVELLRELGRGASNALPGRRLFISRRKLGRSTRIENEYELLGVAKELDFVEMKPETLAYSKQLRRFAEAEIVVGAHGSGLTNAVFMARGTGLCELAPSRLSAAKVPNFWDLAACGGQRYGLCVASGRRVDPERFRRVLGDVIRSQT